jgi:hypothetical protein
MSCIKALADGWVAERLKAPVLKTGRGHAPRGFESHPIRQDHDPSFTDCAHSSEVASGAGACFLASTEQALTRALRADLVVTDNLPAHQVGGGRGAIEARGARRLCLPPDSPDLGPGSQHRPWWPPAAC